MSSSPASERVITRNAHETAGVWDIPQNWTWTTVGNVGEVGLGRQRSPINHSGPHMRPYVRAANVTWTGWDLSDVNEMNFDAADFARFQLQHGDVVLNEGSGSAKEVGKSAIWRNEIADCCFQNTLLRVQPKACTSEYLHAYFSLAARGGLFVSETQGVNIFHIGKDGLFRFPVPLPPLPEQRRIVAKLDALDARAKRARADLDRIPALVARAKQAILKKAFCGKLSESWRQVRRDSSHYRLASSDVKELSDEGIPASWTVSPLFGLAENMDGKRIPVRASDRAERRGQYRYFGASGAIDTIDDYIFDGEFLLIGEDGANLLSRSTPIAYLVSGKFWVNNHAHILRANSMNSNAWLCWWINRIDLAPYVTGSAQPKLTQAAMNRIDVPVPPLSEQAEIIRRIESAFAKIDRMAAEAASASKLLDRLDQAILTQAFRGELVPQDPEDEPAEKLLARIKTASAAARGKTRGRKNRTGATA